MNSILTALVTISERTRDLDEAHRDALIKDIKRNGLLQPIVLGDRPEDPPLIDGLHRLRAVQALHEAGEIILHDGSEIYPNQIPFIRFSDLDPARLLEAEIAANIWRKELTWQERVTALARLHKAQQEENPDATYTETAAKLVGASGKDVKTASTAISRAVVIADAMEADPELAKSRSEGEAFTRVRSDINRLATSILSGGAVATQSRHKLITGSLVEVLPTLEDESVDLILTDPPYGVGADSWTSKFKDAPHDYKDTWPHARELYRTIFSEGLRITKPRACCVAFLDITRWNELREIAELHGWSVWPRPVIWHKSNEGIAPWGVHGYTYVYESFLLATKGGRGLLDTSPDVISGIYKVRNREHGAAKPVELFSSIIKSICYPGDSVLDPCCGSGTIFPAATATGTIGCGIEINPHFVGLAQERMNEQVEDTKPSFATDDDWD